MAKIEQAFVTKQIKIHGEIRKVEEVDTSWTNKEGKLVEGKAILLSIDDDDMARVMMYDKCSDNITSYKVRQTGTFTIRLDYKPTFGTGNIEGKILIIGFEEDAE